MADHDVDSLLSTLFLSSAEEKLLLIRSEELAEGLELCNRSLIGKFQSREEVIIQKSAMILAWESDFSFINLRDNIYQFIFESEEKLNQIVDNGPWCFDGIHLVVRKWRDDWEFFLDESEFWVHIVCLPLKYCIPSVGKRLISFFEGCKKVELREEAVSGKRFFRLRIQVNVSEPFRRVVLLSSDDGKSIIRGLIQYEGLPNLCHVCGLCDHTMSNCDDDVSLSASEQLPFGPWLNANRESSLLAEVQQNAAEFEDKNVVDQPKNAATEVVSKAGRFKWTIENFSRLDVKKTYSDVFVVGGYKWRLMLFPKGNNVENLSLYLDVADVGSLPNGWSRKAQFSFAVVNQIVSKFTVKKETQHVFNQKEGDWGFTSFMPLSELNDPVKGFLVNDTAIIEADVDVS